MRKTIEIDPTLLTHTATRQRARTPGPAEGGDRRKRKTVSLGEDPIALAHSWPLTFS